MEENEDFSETTVFESEVACEPDLVRLGGKSQEDTNTRRGQSALVPGISFNRTSVSRHFSGYGTSTISDPTELQTDVQVSIKTSDLPRRESVFKGRSLQEIERDLQSYPVYSIQAERYIHDDTTASDGETTHLLLPMAGKVVKRKYTFPRIKCYKTVIFLIVLGAMLLVALSVALTYVSLSPGTLSKQIYINNKDMFLLDFFNTFLYKELKIRKALDNQCTDCNVEVYSFYPDSLIVGDNYFNKSSGILTATHDDVLLAPKYYVSGSQIKMFVEFYPTKGQNSSVEFVLFNDLHQYDAYRRGDKTNPHQIYPVQVNEEKKAFSLLLMFTETGYYFIGIRPIDTPITFQSTFIAHQIYYSRSDFPPPTCVLESTDSCTIRFSPSVTDEYTDTLKMCVLVYSVPPQEVSKSYFVSLNYDVYRGFWMSRSEGLLVSIVLTLVFLFFASLYCCVCCLRTKVVQAKAITRK